MADDLILFEQWFGQILAGLAPAQRRRAALKLGQALRRSNTARIAANVEPDGGPMERRKPRLDRRGRLRKRGGGRMFRKLRLAGHLRIDADQDGVELAFRNRAGERVAAEHHFGGMGVVGRLRDGRVIRTRYPARALLGFSDDDRRLALDIAAELLEPDR